MVQLMDILALAHSLGCRMAIHQADLACHLAEAHLPEDQAT